MAYTTINKSSEHFNTKLYTGNVSAGRSITGVGFQPDLVWNKIRSISGNHHWYDAVRGTQKFIRSNDNTAQGTNGGTDGITAFGTDGYTIGGNTGINANNETYASWNWKANGSGSANTVGSINSTVSVNTTSGFSIVKWTGDRSQTQTIGHGLGSIPKIIIVKNLDVTQGWTIYSSEIGANERLVLNNTNAKGTCTACFGNTRPTDTVFTVGDDADTNGTGNNMIAYCFAEKTGYSKFGSYSGNGNVDGNFIYTGFKPAFFMQKRTDTAGNWAIFDNKRANSFNEITACLEANQSNVEQNNTGYNDVDFLSNGIKIREDNGDLNTNGGTYIYMAFAEAPLVGTNGVTAKAR